MYEGLNNKLLRSALIFVKVRKALTDVGWALLGNFVSGGAKASKSSTEVT
jgi:hypothetical protein